MITDWLDYLAAWILSAPGNTDPNAGALWDPPYFRLGCASAETALATKVFWDFLEDTDATDQRPFFVLREEDARWEDYTVTPGGLIAGGKVIVAYTEAAIAADPAVDATLEHTASKRAFLDFAGRLYQWMGENAQSCRLPIVAMHEEIHASRSVPEHRDLDVAGTDYWWIAWAVYVGIRK